MGFSKDKNLKESKFNFNKSNHYGSIKKESNSVESYTHYSVQNSKDCIQKQNNKVSNLIEDSKNNRSNICFNNGLIYTFRNNEEKIKHQAFYFKKHEVHKHTETFVTENNEAIQYLLEIKKGEECSICKKIID